MKDLKATQLAVRTMFLSELTGINPNLIIRYFALLEAIPDASLDTKCTVTGLCPHKVKELQWTIERFDL